jgi:orotate phosphoribosyltransferase
VRNSSGALGGLVDHLKRHALRTDGPFTLSSGAASSWYLDGRQTTFDGVGAAMVGRAVIEALDPDVTAVGGLTMGADPVAVATAIAGSRRGLRAFSIRKHTKEHGTGGRIVGPLRAGDRVALVDDTVTTGSSFIEAAEVLRSEGIEILQAVALVDRSGGVVSTRLGEKGIPFVGLVTPAELGVDSA